MSPTAGQLLRPLPLGTRDRSRLPTRSWAVRGGAWCSPPTPGQTRMGTRTSRGSEEALPGCQEVQGTRPARAHQEGRQVLGRLSCSPQSVLALRAGLGRLGAPGGRGSLWGPIHGEPWMVTARQVAPAEGRPLPRLATTTAPSGATRTRSRQDPGTLTRRLSRSPPNPDPSMSMKV